MRLDRPSPPRCSLLNALSRFAQCIEQTAPREATPNLPHAMKSFRRSNRSWGRAEEVRAMFKRTLYQALQNRLQEARRFIQVLAGPRQTGKTTLARQVLRRPGGIERRGDDWQNPPWARIWSIAPSVRTSKSSTGENAAERSTSCYGEEASSQPSWLRTTLIPHASPPASLPVQAYAQHLLLSAPVILEVRVGDVGRQ